MKSLQVLTLGALCVASSGFWSCTTCLAAAQDAVSSSDGPLGSESAVEVEKMKSDHATEACLQLGFDMEALDCRICGALSLSLAMSLKEDDALIVEKQRETEKILAACDRCCTDVEAIDGHATKAKYASVELEVCTCKFNRLPKIANFVHNHAANHPRLEIKYMNARYPHLIFYDDAGDKKEEVSIASWDEETISEFIEAKLKPVDNVEKTPETTGTLVDDSATGTNEGETDDQPQQKVEVEEEEQEEAVEAAAQGEQESADDDDVVEVEVSVDGE